MRLIHRIAVGLLVMAAACHSAVAHAQVADPLAGAAAVIAGYIVRSNITYLTTNNWNGKLDVHQPFSPSDPSPRPTLVYFHGGGWTSGAKEDRVHQLQPYLQMGWSVVNVEYRLATVSLAPAAVEDCRCALRWVIVHAKEYHLDPARIVVTGDSAGGHLALMTGMLAASAGLDRQCAGTEDLKVAAIVNWYGVTDVADLLEGPNMKTYAVRWFGALPNREPLARLVSPLTHVRPGLPPVITIHGDADPTVPYTHAVRLHQALTEAGVPNQLVTVPGGRHGRFGQDQTLRALVAVREFLARHNLTAQPPGK
ncbi:MAG TPA: alpha/beta hydrolase [Vicinamibacterales bacterium]|jgi:acetyl esterase/lipase